APRPGSVRTLRCRRCSPALLLPSGSLTTIEGAETNARGDSAEQRTRHEANGRHRAVQQVGEHVDEDRAHGDVAAETLEEVRAVAQPLDHRVELIGLTLRRARMRPAHDFLHTFGP